MVGAEQAIGGEARTVARSLILWDLVGESLAQGTGVL